jgi:hypothetical protein
MAFVSDTAMALIEEGTLLGTRQLDMGNSGQKVPATYLEYTVAK